MKQTIFLIAFVVAARSEGAAQSKSFQALEKKFSSNEEVCSFTTSGFFARTILFLAGEHEFKKAIKQIKNIRLITIPKSAFEEKAVSVNGFKNVVRNDAYEELAIVRDQGEEISVYIQPLENSSLQRYFILIDNPEEVVAVEIKGYIDISLLNHQDQDLSYKP